MADAYTKRTRILGLLTVLGLSVLALHTVTSGSAAEQANAVFTECADGIDNDHDGRIDYPQDPQCLSLFDDSEGTTGRGLFVSLSDGKATVKAGDSLTYIIALRTEREEPMIVDVYFQMPHQTNLIGASNGGSRNEELISWKDVSVFPGTERKLTVTVSVSPQALEGLLLVSEVVSEGEKATDTTKVEPDPNETTKQLPQLKVTITDGKKYAQPGEVLDYVIAVRNPTDTERMYNLRMQIPTDTNVEFVSGDQSGNRQAISWNDQVIGPRGSREYKVSVRIEHDAREFYMVRTWASIGASTSSDTTTVHTGVLPNAISVTTTDGLDRVVRGALITYDIAVENNSNQLATEVDVANALPNYMEFVDASEGGYWTGTNVLWENLSVAPSGNRTLRVTGRVRSDAPMGGVLRNTVSVKGFQSVDQTSIGEAIAGIGLQQTSDVLITKNADRTEVRPGQTVMYTVSLRNVTDHIIQNLFVQDRMDSPFIQITSAEYGQLGGNAIDWTIPSLAPGGEWSVRYTAKIDERAPHGIMIPNIVTVSGLGTETISLEERIHTMQIGVISNLPPTGAAFDALFLGLSGLAGGLQTIAQRKKLMGIL